MAELKANKKRKGAAKQVARRAKTSARREDAERSAPTLASEANLKCWQLKAGTRQTCGAPAIGHLALFGDSCANCARGQTLVMYATSKPSAAATKAA
jgi:hypothetical protein